MPSVFASSTQCKLRSSMLCTTRRTTSSWAHRLVQARRLQTRSYVREVSLVIIDEIHLLGGDRGPILEIIVSRMNYIAMQSKESGGIRLLGMSTAAANASDLGNWLGVKPSQGLFNFRHSVRPVPLEP